ncbi:aspartate aminotransferase family protein (plasmid) [Pseudorhodobacter turbinis]|uniref:Aspartate aminotransferase family protein n=1 Tax=Pseudorhodobacter turbinis TaxID=2500533 RepID=A0A4P8EJ35_9RHOB|nr:aspartate aminotransferase family protein [Pseudorhodobacter turbinis]QCO57181.1 aspartate aminotransferase family protein [Pseudorhodobacter turbinis]
MPAITNHMPTKELQALDAAHHIHPFTDANELAESGARIITRAEGVTLTDSEGNQIMDAMSGLWCVNIGYGRQELVDAAARQMQELPFYNTFFMTSHVPVIALSAKLAELAPGTLNHVFYSSSGSEANDTNIRIVRHYWASKGKPEKTVMIARKNGYHGSTLGGGSLGGMAPMHSQGVPVIPGIVHIDQPHWWNEGGDMTPEEFGLERARQLEAKILELGEDNVAAFIGEPIQGAGGVVIPPSTYWPEIQRICDKYEILLIADEVICGFGRTGSWFGSQTMGIRPDIMTIAKGLTSGYIPMGGSLVSDEIANTLAAAGDFNHGYTYSGHPVAAAVALENLRILQEEKLVERVHDDVGPYLAKQWATLLDHPLVGEANSVGLMGTLALTPGKAKRAKFAGKEGAVGLRCRTRCFANGLVMRHVGDRMIIAPPLVITHAEIDTLVERARKSLDETYEGLLKDGLFKAA